MPSHLEYQSDNLWQVFSEKLTVAVESPTMHAQCNNNSYMLYLASVWDFKETFA